MRPMPMPITDTTATAETPDWPALLAPYRFPSQWKSA